MAPIGVRATETMTTGSDMVKTSIWVGRNQNVAARAYGSLTGAKHRRKLLQRAIGISPDIRSLSRYSNVRQSPARIAIALFG